MSIPIQTFMLPSFIPNLLHPTKEHPNPHILHILQTIHWITAVEFTAIIYISGVMIAAVFMIVDAINTVFITAQILRCWCCIRGNGQLIVAVVTIGECVVKWFAARRRFMSMMKKAATWTWIKLRQRRRYRVHWRDVFAYCPCQWLLVLDGTMYLALARSREGEH